MLQALGRAMMYLQCVAAAQVQVDGKVKQSPDSDEASIYNNFKPCASDIPDQTQTCWCISWPKSPLVFSMRCVSMANFSRSGMPSTLV